MPEPARPALSAAGRAYVGAVGWLGIGVFVYCVAVLARDGVASPAQCLMFAGLTLASGRLTFKVPKVEARFSASELFAFTTVLLFGPAAGAVTLAVDSLVLCWRHGMSRQQALFNFGSLALSVWLSGTLFFATAATGPLFSHAPSSERLILPLALMAASYFLANSGLIATAIGYQTGQSPVGVWRTHFMWVGPGYAAGASMAMLMVVMLRQVQFSALALLLPTLLVSYLMLRSSFGRLADAEVHLDRLNGLYLSTIETLATAIDAKDEVTHGHIRRVQGASVALAREMGITDASIIKAIEAAGLLHDTGKIAVPEHILNKPGRLTPAEFEKMKLHAPIGADILSSIDFPYPVVPIVRHHHENWDGTGYPDGLRGTDIPIGARILSVVDCFDALTSDRPYRPAMSEEDAMRIVLERRGTMYDPLVVDTFARTYRQVMPAPEVTPHPAATAVGAARARALADCAPPAPPATPAPPGLLDELAAFTSLSRTVCGEAGISDVGAVLWMMIRQVVPCESMALFVPDEATDSVVARHASGTWASALRQARHEMTDGPVAWTAVTRRAIVNSESLITDPADPRQAPIPCRVCTMPLVHGDRVEAVVALYATSAAPFTEQHARVLELLAPRLASAFAALMTRHTASDPVDGMPEARPAGPELRLVRVAARA
jgi:putative nucleotidyltransferase with HDIG domain